MLRFFSRKRRRLYVQQSLRRVVSICAIAELSCEPARQLSAERGRRFDDRERKRTKSVLIDALRRASPSWHPVSVPIVTVILSSYKKNLNGLLDEDANRRCASWIASRGRQSAWEGGRP